MKNLIIIDDNKEYVDALISSLGDYNCHHFDTIDACNDVIDELYPDVILADCCMLLENGDDLLKEMRLKFMTLPIIIMSKSDNEQACQKSISAGASYFFKKGQVSFEDLIMKIKMLEGMD